MKKELLGAIIAILIYSLGGFAYMHATFSTKEVFTLIKDRLENIEAKLDRLIEKELTYAVFRPEKDSR